MHAARDALQLDDVTDAVPRARRFVADALASNDVNGVAADAELIAAELVTNALLHAGAPVELRVRVHWPVVRIEVADLLRAGPMRALASPDAMTGRGLTLVAALSHRWGAEPTPRGKTVWAELVVGSPPEPADRRTADADVDALLAAWSDEPSDEPRFTVRLGDVPTELLLAAKAHVDNLVREFTLAAAGAATGSTAAVPTPLATLIESVTMRFADARRSIKRQAIAAAQAGAPRTTLVLHLPASAADAGEEYLAALDEADRYARAARLLTLATPPQQRAFRHWYVETLVEQLRRAAAGEPPGESPTFEDRLLAELATLSEAHRTNERAARLQTVTAALASARTPEEVAAVVVSEGVAALDASGGSVLVPIDGTHLAVPAAVGYGAELVEMLRAEPPDAQLPAAYALRTGTPVWLESLQERDERFPALRGLEPHTVSMCALPLVAGGRIVGALRFSFSAQRLFGDDERRFALTLAAQTAQALDRSRLYAIERAARDAAETSAARLRRLQGVTAALVGAGSVEEVADVVVNRAATLPGAHLAALSVTTDGDAMCLVRVLGARPESLADRDVFPLAAELPASVAVRTGEVVVSRGIAELRMRFADLPDTEDQVLVTVPLTLADGPVGALSVSFPPDYDIGDDEVNLLVTIGRQCALALSRVRLFERERVARNRVAFLARASELLMSSLEPSATAAHLAGLVVPALADRATVHLVDDTGTPRLAAAVPPREVEPGPDSAVVEIPLALRNRDLGILMLTRSTGAYTDDELRLAEDVAARAAVAVFNAQQFSRERDAAVTLQRSLLPQTLPRVPGLTFAWRYRPGDTTSHVGGDWYDVIPLGDGGVGLVIGDVMGRGLRAAAVMGQLRATARAYATAHLAPHEVIARLDEAVSGLEQGQITTALYGVLDPRTGRFTVSSAGHLPPLLIPAGGRPEYVRVDPGPPLGVGGPYAQQTVALPPGATLLLYTDGLVESRIRPVDIGMDELRDAAESAASPEDLCDRALIALGRTDGHDDDTAMLAVRLDAPAP